MVIRIIASHIGPPPLSPFCVFVALSYFSIVLLLLLLLLLLLIIIIIIIIITTNTRAMAQAVSRRPLIAEERVQSQANPRRIGGGQNDNKTGFSPNTSVFPC
jgi:uncharacterized protein (DUF58 family)